MKSSDTVSRDRPRAKHRQEPGSSLQLECISVARQRSIKHTNMAPLTGQKRKGPPPSFNASSSPRKRVKMQDARTIAVQKPPDQLDVSSFIQAREFEIKALESSVTKSKKALSTRAFQQVPRSMRRRTASHNVTKVPKRLQARAKEEVCRTARQASWNKTTS